MSDPLFERLGGLLRSNRPWYTLPRLFAMPRLNEIRKKMRRDNLHDTEEPPFEKRPIPPNLDPAIREARTVDGTSNDLAFPRMGSVGCRFGRNVPLQHAFPDTANLMTPSPRVVSRELMTRDDFKPATILNLMAASWIQFMVHDWFVHKRSAPEDGLEIPLAPGDDWAHGPMKVRKSVPDPAPAGSTRPPAYANLNSHWWDGSQIYGNDPAVAARLRSGEGGKLRVLGTRLLPVDAETGIELTGFIDNWWIGLAMLHTLFALEHNHVCDLFARDHPDWTDDQLYGKAKLVTSALLAKIHTVEWTPAILPNKVVGIGMRANWYGLADDDLVEIFRFLEDSDILGGIVGSKHDHHAAPYALTEEFVSVYRMHPLIPDEYTFRSLTTGLPIQTLTLPQVSARESRTVAERISMPDLFYSFGVSHPGAITLRNYPRHLQTLVQDGETFDLAAVDILRDRERGVPRYNQFRRLLDKPPVRSFDELTDDPQMRQALHQVYGGDLEKVDLMTGLYAEPLPEGFGFSETAFRIFILMASRRLKSDRFFTDDYRAEIYTEFGLDYIHRNSMLTVLRRHVPQLEPALAGVENAFQPWKPVAADAPSAPSR